MQQSTCALHECTTIPDGDARWCTEHRPTVKSPKKPCPGCGRAIGPAAKHCMWCNRNLRFFGTLTPELPKCKVCGATITGRNRARGVYCSRKCVYASPEVMAKLTAPRNSVLKVCVGCKVEFYVAQSNAERYNYCTRDCSMSHRGAYGNCKRCGKEFRYGLGSPPRTHCSEECYRPAHYFNCLECGKRQRTTPSTADSRRFCDRRCYRRYTGETSIETSVREVIESVGLFYSQEENVGGWVVDFLVLPNIVIEADGDYWHQLRPDVDARKTAEIEALGYVVIRISETDIRSGVFRKPLLKALRKGALV